MTNNELLKIENLIKSKKINEAQIELSKLGNKFLKNPEYLYLRSQVFYLNKLYYIAIDTLLIALEFGKSDKVYNLIAEIYSVLGNDNLSKKFSNFELRSQTADLLKKELSGLHRENN